MQKNILKVSLCLFLLNCTSTKTNTYNQQMKQAFIFDFKITYFKKLLVEGFNKTDAIKSIVKQDQSGFGEIILSQNDYDLLDSLVKIDNEFMRKDSLNRIGRVAEGAQGKRVLAYALSKYESKWLDTLAKARSKIFMKNFKAN